MWSASSFRYIHATFCMRYDSHQAPACFLFWPDLILSEVKSVLLLQVIFQRHLIWINRKPPILTTLWINSVLPGKCHVVPCSKAWHLHWFNSFYLLFNLTSALNFIKHVYFYLSLLKFFLLLFYLFIGHTMYRLSVCWLVLYPSGVFCSLDWVDGILQ
jgi:hypothetical protein